MGKFKLAFGIHNHQPVGNFSAVFEDAHQRAYLPFLKLLSKFPGVRISLHQSGILWDWQKRAHPDYFTLVGSMIDRRQIELLTGGFYEPILTAIPERDGLAQISRLTEYLSEHFETQPKGLWLTERIWEPHLPKILNAAGVEFLPIDDTHFIYAGFESEQLTGPFITEYEGNRVRLLPIQKRLRYLIPFAGVDEVIDYLKRCAEHNEEGLAVYADDGEKFGVWPKTHEHCYGDRWLEKLFKAFDANSDWLEIVPLSEAAAAPSVGRAYIPSASYAEMLHWSLPPQAFIEYEEFEKRLKEFELDERYSRFVRGGHWRGFLSKYEESNLMHKRALEISDRLARLEADQPHLDTSHARDRLFAGQCNCPYWHGVFGGLYLPHIRQAIWQALIEADAELDRLEQSSGISQESKDFDYDGYDEVSVSSVNFHAVVKPSHGGTLLNLNMKKHAFDPTDTLTRRKEGYHLRLDRAVLDGEPSDETSSIHDLVLTKEPGLKDLLVEDWYLKRCFIDHFFTPDVDLARFASARFGEEGDFILEPYRVEKSANVGEVLLSREGHLWRPEGVIPVRVQKTYSFGSEEDIIKVSYALETESHATDVIFAVENNFNFQAGHADDRFILVDNFRHTDSYLDSVGEHEDVSGVALLDQYRALAVAQRSSRSCRLWHLPIFTVSLSEGGFEKVYQGTTLVQIFHLKVSREPQHIDISLFAGSSDAIPRELLIRQAMRTE